MRLSYIKKLIKLVEESDVATIEITKWGRSVRVEKLNPNSGRAGNSSGPHTRESTTIAVPVVQEAPPVKSRGSAVEEERDEKPEIEMDFTAITAPMVGTFYRAPSPDAPPYVEVGDVVTNGQVLCIIEAMKLMNEIQSEVDGKIRKVLVENGEPIEYGQELFLIEP